MFSLFKNVQIQTAECIAYVHRQSKGWRWWKGTAEDGEGDEKAFEAFGLPACIQEFDKDQIPHSNGKAVPASHASGKDGKCPRQRYNREESEVEERCSTTAEKKEAEERTAAVTY